MSTSSDTSLGSALTGTIVADALAEAAPPPSSTMRAFFSGFLKSAASSAAIMTLIFLLTKGAAALTPFVSGALVPAAGPFFITLAIASVAVGLFSGVMHAMEAKKHGAHGHGQYVTVPVQGMAGPAIVPVQDIAPEAAITEAPTRNWSQSVGRSGDAQSRVQEILSNGSMSDKDRASAILAAREAETKQPARA